MRHGEVTPGTLTKGRTVWFTGLSGSGKSVAVAVIVEQMLLGAGARPTSSTATTCGTASTPTSGSRWPTARENLRRLAHVATLMADAG